MLDNTSWWVGVALVRGAWLEVAGCLFLGEVLGQFVQELKCVEVVSPLHTGGRGRGRGGRGKGGRERSSHKQKGVWSNCWIPLMQPARSLVIQPPSMVSMHTASRFYANLPSSALSGER